MGEKRLPMPFRVELGYKVTAALGPILEGPLWGWGMSGTYVPQLPAGPFLTARGKCGPASALQRTLGQLPGLVLSRRILFSEKQAQGGMFLAERSSGKFDGSPTSHRAIKERLAGVRHPLHLRWCFHVSQQSKRGHGLGVKRRMWSNWPATVEQFHRQKHPRKTGQGPYTPASSPRHTSPLFPNFFLSFSSFKQFQKMEKRLVNSFPKSVAIAVPA